MKLLHLVIQALLCACTAALQHHSKLHDVRRRLSRPNLHARAPSSLTGNEWATWAGAYLSAPSDDGFFKVKSSFVVPGAAFPPGPLQYGRSYTCAIFVSIGHDLSTGVFQAGVLTERNPTTDALSSTAWYQWLPHDPWMTFINKETFSVRIGDEIRISLETELLSNQTVTKGAVKFQNMSNMPQDYIFGLFDMSPLRGATASFVVENWKIRDDVTGQTVLTPFANFGEVVFPGQLNKVYTKSGREIGFESARLEDLSLDQGTTINATTSKRGDSVVVTYKAPTLSTQLGAS